MAGVARIKAAVRNGLPPAWQVPAKYWHARLTGTLEPEMALLSRLVPSGARAIDVGGNYGAYALALSGIGARVEVFEPHPVCLRALSGWARGRERVTVHPFALSDRDGEAELAIPVDADGTEHDAAGSVDGSVHAGPVRTHRVALRRLDDFGFTDAALVKIDVEGHEAAVIEGALATIATARPALLIEIEQRHRSDPIATTFARIAGLGHDGYFLMGGVLLPVAQFNPAIHQRADTLGRSGYYNNFLFLPCERDYPGLTAP
ncbi:FkbM family methyltransferase [Sphingomonas sp. Leaf4]|uniref:FkbM family methyltransferase n=1 Tax=Sphingomonas sp. Leaf4 TaxID=2876553 RepID=UPI001E50598D|nr:FkbM family methyltransferase [Sphingomonas sp. Leaf4]